MIRVIKIIFIFLMLVLVPVLSVRAESTDYDSLDGPLKMEIVKFAEDSFKNPGFAERFLVFIKGKPVDNHLLLGMISYHSSHKHFNNVNNLIGLDYKGLSVGTFKNSYWDRSYYIAVGRKFKTIEFSKDFKLDLEYRAGVLHGYKDRYPNMAGFTPIILPYMDFNYKHSNLFLLIIPGSKPIFCTSLGVKL